MTDFLVRIFVKNNENISDPTVRRSFGMLSSIVGIICNTVLFAAKYFIGTLSGSISVISDSFNNLSDSASCVIALFGYRLASKPADKEHPFGHGRLEYLTSLALAVIITLVGFELLCSSIGRIASPEEVSASAVSVAALVISIAVKLWMSVFNKRLGKRISSPVMLAASEDSRSDVIATSAALIGLVSSLFTGFPLDGVMGAAVSLIIMKSGIDIIRTTVDDLIGRPLSDEIKSEMLEIITRDERVLGVHDIIVHCYGPGNYIGSCHAEMSEKESFLSAHAIADAAEREIYASLGILMTIHMDPTQTDSTADGCKSELSAFAETIAPGMTIHDFRTEQHSGGTVLIFDAAVPYGCTLTNEDINGSINAFVSEKYGSDHSALVTFDRKCL